MELPYHLTAKAARLEVRMLARWQRFMF